MGGGVKWGLRMNVVWQGTACKPRPFYVYIINVYSNYCKKGWFLCFAQVSELLLLLFLTVTKPCRH